MVAVKVFDTEPSPNSVSVSTGRGLSTLGHAGTRVGLPAVRPHPDSNTGNAELCCRRLDEIGQRVVCHSVPLCASLRAAAEVDSLGIRSDLHYVQA